VTNGGKLLLRRKPPVLSRAVATWKPGIYDPTLDSLMDLTGHGLHMRLGSAVGPDTNDPLRLRLNDGGKRVYFPGTTGNYLQRPYTASDNIAGDVEYVVRARLKWATSATPRHFRNRWNNLGGTAGYAFVATTSGRLQFWCAIGGSQYFPTITHNLQDDVDYYVKFRRIAATGAVSFWSSPDGLTWTQQGATQSTPAGDLAGSTQNTLIGCENTGTGAGIMFGDVWFDELRAGVDGTPVSRFDVTGATEPFATVADRVSGTWAFNRSASGAKLAVVDRDVCLLGTDDYLEVADNALLNFGAGQPFTAAIALRHYGSSANQALLCKKAGTNDANTGWMIYKNLGGNYLNGQLTSDGTSTYTPSAAQGAITPGQACLASLSRDALQRFAVNGEEKGTAAASLRDLTNALVLRIGSVSGASLYADFEFCGAAIFRESLSQSELRRLAVELGVAP
jgi:hypothetical protein